MVGTLFTVLGIGNHLSFLTGLGSFIIFLGILGILNMKVAVPGTLVPGRVPAAPGEAL